MTKVELKMEIENIATHLWQQGWEAGVNGGEAFTEKRVAQLMDLIDQWIAEVIGNDEEIPAHEFGSFPAARNFLRYSQRQRAGINVQTNQRKGEK